MFGYESRARRIRRIRRREQRRRERMRTARSDGVVFDDLLRSAARHG